MWIRRLAATGCLLTCLALVACRPSLQVQIATRVFHDGSLERSLTVIGRTADGEQPAQEGWFGSEAGLRLAEPQGWARIERAPGRIDADGFYGGADELPALLTLGRKDSQRNTRGATTLRIEERALIRRWDYVERHGDPYSAIDRAAALRELIDRAVEIIDAELRREFGEEFDSEPARRFLRDELHSLIASLLVVNRSVPGKARLDERLAMWRQTLEDRRIPTAVVEEGFWDVQLPLLIGWSRDEIALRLAAAGSIAPGERLAFLPGPDNWEERGMELVERHIGDEDQLDQELGAQLRALSGYFGDGGIPHFRFESSVSLPGSLLLSNGTCAESNCRWLFREDDLQAGEVSLRASSVEPIEAALVRLGARRSFDARQLIQLVDLLWKRDPQGDLRDALTEAIRLGDRDWLLEEDVVPDELDNAIVELYELLEP
jgi:hypothetical protein